MTDPTVWRDISSAPKDGTLVLIGHYDGWVNEARWIEYDRYAGTGGGWFDANTHPTDATDGESHPTHWMPLPPPPSEGGDNRSSSAPTEAALRATEGQHSAGKGTP